LKVGILQVLLIKSIFGLPYIIIYKNWEAFYQKFLLKIPVLLFFNPFTPQIHHEKKRGEMGVRHHLSAYPGRLLETLDGKHSPAEVRQSVFMYIEAYYNRVRLHSAPGYVATDVFNSGHVA
jgi:hypothetical protein